MTSEGYGLPSNVEEISPVGGGAAMVYPPNEDILISQVKTTESELSSGLKSKEESNVLRPNGLPVPDYADVVAANHVLKTFFPGIRPERANYLVNFSPRLHYLYLETPKVACSSIKRTLQRLELGFESQLPANIHDRDLSPLWAAYDSLSEFLSAQFDPRYVCFSFVRNPFGRILSCYLEKILQTEWERKKLLPELGFTSDQIPSFREFLLALQKQKTNDLDIHLIPQSTILDGLKNPSFIGRFESFSTDFNKVLQMITGEPTNNIVKCAPHASGADRRVSEMIGRPERDLIVEIYDDDFVRYSYSRDPRFV